MSSEASADLLVKTTTPENVSTEIINLPNSLTLLRIFLVPFLVVVLLTKFYGRGAYFFWVYAELFYRLVGMFGAVFAGWWLFGDDGQARGVGAKGGNRTPKT